jgi:hypothetical protein
MIWHPCLTLFAGLTLMKTASTRAAKAHILQRVNNMAT